VLAYYRTDGLSNARCEATNGLVKKIKRIGHGFRNLDNYRLRLLLHCGSVNWHDQPAARLRRRRYRKRHPPLVAQSPQTKSVIVNTADEPFDRYASDAVVRYS
jgi:hypothetical protein